MFIWHGTEYYIFIWTLLNFIGISLEVFGNWVDKQTAVFHFVSSQFRPNTSNTTIFVFNKLRLKLKIEGRFIFSFLTKLSLLKFLKEV